MRVLLTIKQETDHWKGLILGGRLSLPKGRWDGGAFFVSELAFSMTTIEIYSRSYETD